MSSIILLSCMIRLIFLCVLLLSFDKSTYMDNTNLCHQLCPSSQFVLWLDTWNWLYSYWFCETWTSDTTCMRASSITCLITSLHLTSNGLAPHFVLVYGCLRYTHLHSKIAFPGLTSQLIIGYFFSLNGTLSNFFNLHFLYSIDLRDTGPFISTVLWSLCQY